ncbi:MarC family protein [Fluviicola sp.]|jgi:MarC family membrane protein|uniref:MarC family protein n=1 Tax=Fluviicola sp. TaxID=1917219 RepID=UPI00282911AD|nr:MarC family protein [Fluviicola sp.]MDR0801903.1 MarC family protein [Fluviicola sp.]
MHLHDLIYTFIASFLALFPPVNPIGDSLIVNRYTMGLNEKERKQIVWRITRNCMVVGISSLFVGHFVLQLFGLATPVVQFAGGMLIFKTGMEGLVDTSDKIQMKNDSEQIIAEKSSLNEIKSKIFYPLSFPICIGPGTISVIFTLMANSSKKEGGLLVVFTNYAIIILAILVLCALIYIFCIQGQKLILHLGESGILVIMKLVSFITVCIGIQIAVTGISKIFHLTIL